MSTMDKTTKLSMLINSTAGAVPVKNEKGEIYMQKVKVTRYVTGKRPDFAPSSDEDDDAGADADEFISSLRQRPLVAGATAAAADDDDGDTERAAAADTLTSVERQDPRLQRLLRQRQSRHDQADSDDDDDQSDGHSDTERARTRHRRLHKAEVVDDSSDNSERESSLPPLPPDGATAQRRAPAVAPAVVSDSSSSGGGSSASQSESSEEEMDDEQLLRRRQMLRERALAHAKKEEELLELEDEKSDDDDEDDGDLESEYEECTDSEQETGPRLKPVFVRKEERATIKEKEQKELKQKQAEIEAKKMAEERRKYTLKMVESEIRKETEQNVTEDASLEINTEDENDETAYELWKLRELKRIKRDKEEREAHERERQESERLRKMTEEERRAELRANPKQITNKVAKGKYKFLQKYYHRGAFYLDSEENVLKRDHTAPTLEDKFDKTVLPKVMQVKNFGRSGRTKYTHLIDQDTTVFDSAWTAETAHNVKFFASQAGGMKQEFERPAVKKQRAQLAAAAGGAGYSGQGGSVT